ncbi:transposase family protein [Streptomyces sp. NPDC051658]|uniref:transposase family protein n=1 Tax=Streptomyces sp. NPDC051658 TaxID=3365667 RepID=UPI0037A8DE54
MDEILLRLEELLFPSIADVAVLSADVNIAIVRVDVSCTAVGASCPGRGAWSAQVHGSYLRFPADVPSAGRNVVLQLRVRRFTCRNDECGRRTFVTGSHRACHVAAQRPGIEVVCRDRAPFFAEGASAGAPQAVQWHL